MKFNFKVEEPGNIEMTLTITMPLAAWCRLCDQLNNSPDRGLYPAGDLRDAIYDLTHKATAQYNYEPAPVEDPLTWVCPTCRVHRPLSHERQNVKCSCGTWRVLPPTAEKETR